MAELKVRWAIGSVVLHLPTGTIGVVTALYPPGVYRDAENHEVQAEVVQVSTGDAFLVEQDGEPTFRLLTPGELMFHATAQKSVSSIRTLVQHMARASELTPQGANTIWNAVLRQAMKAGLL